MKKTKLKLKKQVWYFVGAFVITIALIMIGIKAYETYTYHKTDEYHLLQAGYTEDDIKILKSYLNKEEISKIATSKKDLFLLKLLQDEYFIKDYFDRYMTYHRENESLSVRNVVSIINTNTDHSYYTYDFDTNLEDDYLMLVNKYYHLNEDYVPDDLVEISNQYYYGENHKIRKIVYDAFIDMWNEAQKDGIYLIINSSYRTYQEQQEVYDFYKDTYGTTYADQIAARPGYSEHQTGLALDIFSKEHTTSTNFKDSPAHLWLKENAYRYGFIQRYDENTQDLTGFTEEAWHWRYVGIEVATYLHKHAITYDEYYTYFILN